ncbi:cation:proton antiporter [uncultured Porphyromonas sp.]|uniref:cation:proton antiporter n=1 Tax=uncultured Porphyromonas sp. TaxID=159274 RepID=UPI002803D3D0|nr:cation:proton antiporter [uncultured Porphyromonas sp.]
MNTQQRQQAWWLYGGLMLIFVALLWWVAATDQAMSGSSEALVTPPVATTEFLSEVPEGAVMAPELPTLSPAGEASPWQSFVASVRAHAASDIGMLLIQLVVILLVVRVVGWIFARLHQPTVIGEILAGILLGPSLLGAVWPEAMETLFPVHSLGNLELLSQFGLILFMFTIGMELRMKDLKGQAQQAFIISQSGIIFPFILGIILTYGLYSRPELLSEGSSFLSLSLFVGISLSITAFPVLARIIQERSLSHSHLGRLALSTAAMGDIVAWLMLAAIMAVSQGGSFTSALYNMLFLALYLAVIFGILRPLFGLLGRRVRHREVLSKSLMGLIFILLMASAYFTEIMSMHALFGAFMLGLVMPENLDFRVIVKEKVEDLALLLLLPLFFVSSGLRTELGLVNTPQLWALFGIFTLVAVVGKMGGTYLAARSCGIQSRESLYLGAYMNTRGLMELVVLRIGLDLGILSTVLFTILVMMTLVTTVMTAPTLQLIDWLLKKKKTPQSLEHATGQVLISFGRAETGVTLLEFFHRLCGGTSPQVACTLMHVTTDTDISTIDADHYYASSFAAPMEMARQLDLSVERKYEIAESVPEAVLSHANHIQSNLLLLGASVNLSQDKKDRDLVAYSNKLTRRWGLLTGRRRKAKKEQSSHSFEEIIATFAHEAPCSVGIYVDNGQTPIAHPLVLMQRPEDKELLLIAEQVTERADSPITLMPLSSHLAKPASELADRVSWSRETFAEQVDLSDYDFALIAYDAWAALTPAQQELLQQLPSYFILDIDEATIELPTIHRPTTEAVSYLGKAS